VIKSYKGESVRSVEVSLSGVDKKFTPKVKRLKEDKKEDKK
jgi:hypothetical protein